MICIRLNIRLKVYYEFIKHLNYFLFLKKLRLTLKLISNLIIDIKKI